MLIDTAKYLKLFETSMLNIKDFADYCVMNDFDVTWSFAFGNLTGAMCGCVAKV